MKTDTWLIEHLKGVIDLVAEYNWSGEIWVSSRFIKGTVTQIDTNKMNIEPFTSAQYLWWIHIDDYKELGEHVQKANIPTFQVTYDIISDKDKIK